MVRWPFQNKSCLRMNAATTSWQRLHSAGPSAIEATCKCAFYKTEKKKKQLFSPTGSKTTECVAKTAKEISKIASKFEEYANMFMNS